MTEPTAQGTAPRGTPNLNKALAAFQAEMPALERDRSVEVETKGDKPNYGYSYATLANVTRVAMPLLGKHGLSFACFPGLGADGKFSLTYSLLHESGEERSGAFPLSAEGGIQALGGRITYARRYCLISVTGLAADEDDDAAHDQAQAEADTGTVQRKRREPAKTAAPERRSAPASAPEPGAAPRETAQRSRPTSPAGPPLPGEADGPFRGRGGLITQPMTAKLAICMKEVGLTGDDRLPYVIDLIDRQIGSSKDLTFDEGRHLIDAFEKAKGSDDPQQLAAVIYVRTTTGVGGEDEELGQPAAKKAARPAARRPAETRSVAEQTRGAVLGDPNGAGADEVAPWDEPVAEPGR